MIQRNPWLWGRDYAAPPAAANQPPPSEELPETPETPPEEPPVETPPETQPTPWAGFTTHAQIDDYMTDNQIEWPEGWTAKTIALKKAWLDENRG